MMLSKQSTDDGWDSAVLKEFVARFIILDLLDGLGHIVHGEVGGHLVHGVTSNGLHLVVSSRYEHHPLIFGLGCKSTHSSHSKWNCWLVSVCWFLVAGSVLPLPPTQ